MAWQHWAEQYKKQITELEIYIENLKATIKSLKISQQKQIDELKVKDQKSAKQVEKLKKEFKPLMMEIKVKDVIIKRLKSSGGAETVASED